MAVAVEQDDLAVLLQYPLQSGLVGHAVPALTGQRTGNGVIEGLVQQDKDRLVPFFLGDFLHPVVKPLQLLIGQHRPQAGLFAAQIDEVVAAHHLVIVDVFRLGNGAVEIRRIALEQVAGIALHPVVVADGDVDAGQGVAGGILCTLVQVIELVIFCLTAGVDDVAVDKDADALGAVGSHVLQHHGQMLVGKTDFAGGAVVGGNVGITDDLELSNGFLIEDVVAALGQGAADGILRQSDTVGAVGQQGHGTLGDHGVLRHPVHGAAAGEAEHGHAGVAGQRLALGVAPVQDAVLSTLVVLSLGDHHRAVGKAVGFIVQGISDCVQGRHSGGLNGNGLAHHHVVIIAVGAVKEVNDILAGGDHSGGVAAVGVVGGGLEDGGLAGNGIGDPIPVDGGGGTQAVGIIGAVDANPALFITGGGDDDLLAAGVGILVGCQGQLCAAEAVVRGDGNGNTVTFAGITLNQGDLVVTGLHQGIVAPGGRDGAVGQKIVSVSGAELHIALGSGDGVGENGHCGGGILTGLENTHDIAALAGGGDQDGLIGTVACLVGGNGAFLGTGFDGTDHDLVLIPHDVPVEVGFHGRHDILVAGGSGADVRQILVGVVVGQVGIHILPDIVGRLEGTVALHQTQHVSGLVMGLEVSDGINAVDTGGAVVILGYGRSLLGDGSLVSSLGVLAGVQVTDGCLGDGHGTELAVVQGLGLLQIQLVDLQVGGSDPGGIQGTVNGMGVGAGAGPGRVGDGGPAGGGADGVGMDCQAPVIVASGLLVLQQPVQNIPGGIGVVTDGIAGVSVAVVAVHGPVVGQGHQHLGFGVVLFHGHVCQTQGTGKLFHEGVDLHSLILAAGILVGLQQAPVVGVVDLVVDDELVYQAAGTGIAVCQEFHGGDPVFTAPLGGGVEGHGLPVLGRIQVQQRGRIALLIGLGPGDQHQGHVDSVAGVGRDVIVLRLDVGGVEIEDLAVALELDDVGALAVVDGVAVLILIGQDQGTQVHVENCVGNAHVQSDIQCAAVFYGQALLGDLREGRLGADGADLAGVDGACQDSTVLDNIVLAVQVVGTAGLIAVGVDRDGGAALVVAQQLALGNDILTHTHHGVAHHIGFGIAAVQLGSAGGADGGDIDGDIALSDGDHQRSGHGVGRELVRQMGHGDPFLGFFFLFFRFFGRRFRFLGFRSEAELRLFGQDCQGCRGAQHHQRQGQSNDSFQHNDPHLNVSTPPDPKTGFGGV